MAEAARAWLAGQDRESADADELNAWRDAAEYDATMEGPKFKGWNRSQLERARKLAGRARRSASSS